MHSPVEFAERILSILEEFTHENVFALLNTIISPKGDRAEVEAFRSALIVLLGAGSVTVNIEGISPHSIEPLSQSRAMDSLVNLDDSFDFNFALGHWTLADGNVRTAKVPAVHLTPAGRAKAEAVLDARGYRWWERS